MSIIYGIREVESDVYFYIGSTKYQLQHRLQQHKDYTRLGYNRNRHFVHKINQVGWDNVAVDILQECDQECQFEIEKEWIDLFKLKRHPLTNIKHADEFPKQVQHIEINLQHVSDFIDIRNGVISSTGDVLHDMFLSSAKKIVDHLFDSHYDVFEGIAIKLVDETLEHEETNEQTANICRRISQELERNRCGA
ncbi:GIY-YIG nuclease family protein [Candidatus Pacearchaeota archaeon]|nr:GIY-YIG nuclease family protein [Candidatus Pacearchaeota archaeon]